MLRLAASADFGVLAGYSGGVEALVAYLRHWEHVPKRSSRGKDKGGENEVRNSGAREAALRLLVEMARHAAHVPRVLACGGMSTAC